MIEIYKKNSLINIKNSDNVIVNVDIEKKEVSIGDYLVDFPGEYEKS